MTDDESRKAFEEWMNAAPYLPQANEAIWQAAVEWATKVERKRCLSLLMEFTESKYLPEVNLAMQLLRTEI